MCSDGTKGRQGASTENNTKQQSYCMRYLLVTRHKGVNFFLEDNSYFYAPSFSRDTGGPLLTWFLRLWKNNRVSGKSCKQTNESTKIKRVIQKALWLENRVSGGLPVKSRGPN